MKRTLILLLGLGIVAVGCDTATPISPNELASADAPQRVRAVPAPEWDALFDRESGWTGADGIFSIPDDGVDAPGSAVSSTTTFLFSDTMIGEVNPDGSRASGGKLINNTRARLVGGAPEPSTIEFVWPEVSGQPKAIVIPDTPEAQAGEWYWNQDGMVHGGTLHSLFLRMGRPSAGGFEVRGVALVSSPVGETLPKEIRQLDTPFFRPDQPGKGNIQFGAGIMENTEEAGAPHPDGYLYVYGVQNDPFNKKLLVACLYPSDIDRFERWYFWNGTTFVQDLDAAVPVTDRISNELSVTPLADGRFLLVHQLDAISSTTAIRYGESPVGPWSAVQSVYTCPEAATDPDTFCYNAKGHPHLSAPGELLVSYNVNTFDFFGDFFRDADIYRPRFFRLTGLPT